ncbi:DUF952 domain-containing protein [Alkalinema sp. FACHB-956]|uniref:DUF952 domain-containing protein n=1 Tax=Alkalinema sp. FACHB-956 TaxID=2692768 RepID=UPI00321F8489
MIEIRCDRIDEIYHITTAPAWQHAQTSGTYRAPSLDTEGFIHCSTREKILWVAHQFYRDQPDLILLCIDPQKITAPWQFDPVPDLGNFPHIYGELNCTAIVRAFPFQSHTLETLLSNPPID